MVKRKLSTKKAVSSITKKLTSKVKSTDPVEIRDLERPEDKLSGSSMSDAAEVISEVKYLVPDWIPFGMVTMLLAEPGVGKSAFALYGLVRPVVMGGCNWFNNTRGPREPGDVIWCDTENSVAINVTRIRKWGIPGKRIKSIFTDPLQQIVLESKDDLKTLDNFIRKFKVKLVIVDSFRGGHAGDENNSQVVKAMEGLANIAQSTGTAIVLIHHTRKMSSEDELTANSSRGSNAIQGMVRSMLGVDSPDTSSDWKRVRMLKENLGLKPAPIGFLVTDEGVEFGPAPVKPIRQTEKGTVKQWLLSRMQSGKTYKSTEIIIEAEQLGYSKVTVQKVASSLGNKPTAVRKGGKIVSWTWTLP